MKVVHIFLPSQFYDRTWLIVRFMFSILLYWFRSVECLV